jgi:GT2 family glycosyltransferase
MNHSEIAAVVVTYNRKELLRQCIECILHQKNQEPDVLIFDNASTDQTDIMVQTFFGNERRVLYFNTGENLGGAGGFSYGIRKAVETGYKYLWIMDDDTMAESDTLDKLVETGELLQGKYGFLSSYVKWKDGTSCKMNMPSAVDPQWYDEIPFLFEHQLFRIKSASFVSCFIKSEMIRLVGLPIKEFFIWGDDTEYTERLFQYYPGYFVYQSQVIHAMKENTTASSIIDADEARLERYFYLYRNRYYIARQHGALYAIKYLFDMQAQIRQIAKTDYKDKKERIRIVRKGCIAGMHFHPQIDFL